jgi:MFS family permease
MESRHSVEPVTWRASAGALPRLSGRSGFWAIALAFLAITAFSATPSSLYGLYGHREHLSSLAITIVFGVYAGGVVVSLLLAGHLSDWYGRRPVLLTTLALVVAAALVFLLWRSLAGLVVARVLTGLGLGAAMATATAFIADLDSGASAVPARRAGIVATTANIGGLALGPLIGGLLGRYAPHPLTLPFVVLLAALVVAVVLVLLSPEGHPAIRPRPRYHPQRLAAPANARRQFIAASTGAFTAFAVSGLFAGLTATFLAGPLHHPSPALIGLTIFLTFGVGALVQTTTTSWPSHRLLAAGITPIITGLCLVVASAWTSPPSLALFLISGVVAGVGVGAIFRGSTTVVLSASGPDDRAGALATFFTVGYAGISLPVIGVGLALQHLSPRVTLLIFGLAAGLVILAAAPVLLRPLPEAARRPQPARHPMTSMCCGFGAEIGHRDSETDPLGVHLATAPSQSDLLDHEREPREPTINSVPEA